MHHSLAQDNLGLLDLSVESQNETMELEMSISDMV